MRSFYSGGMAAALGWIYVTPWNSPTPDVFPLRASSSSVTWPSDRCRLRLITASRPGSSRRSACQLEGPEGCTGCGSRGGWSPRRGGRSGRPRPLACSPTCRPFGTEVNVQVNNGRNPNIGRVLPVFGDRIDFTGLQQEADNLGVSYNNKTHARQLDRDKHGRPNNHERLTFSGRHVQRRPGVVVPLLHVHGGQRKPSAVITMLHTGQQTLNTTVTECGLLVYLLRAETSPV